MKAINCLLISLFTILSCNKQSEFLFPLIQTGEVTDIDSTGAVFHASITDLSKGNITDYGFVWNQAGNPDINSSKILLTEMPKVGIVSIKVSTDLFPDTVYYVRAFIRNEAYITYGKEVKFRSKGSLIPVILDFSPKEGGESTEITITGKNFSSIPESNTVMFGKVKAIVKYDSKDKLVVTLPEVLNISGKVKITVETSGRKAESASLFQLPGCDILGFRPGSLMIGDPIHFKATGIAPDINDNILIIGGATAEIYEIVNDSIYAYVPYHPILGNNEVSLTVSGKTCYSPDLIYIKNPFSKIDGTNSLFRSGAVGFAIENKGYIGLGMRDAAVWYDDLWEYNFENNTWKKCSNIPGRGRSDAMGFSIGGKGYVCLGTNYEDPQTFFTDLYEYDPSNDSWTKKADFPGEARIGHVSIVIGNKAYVGLGFNQFTGFNDFWEYDPELDKWKQVSNYPGSTIVELSGFSIADKGYLGLGNGTGRELWEYNPSGDTWLRLADFPGTLRYLPVCFSIGKNGYIAMGLSASDNEGDLNDLWRYEPSKNKWSRLADVPYNGRVSSVGFSIGNTGYICSGVNNDPERINDENFIVFNPD